MYCWSILMDFVTANAHSSKVRCPVHMLPTGDGGSSPFSVSKQADIDEGKITLLLLV
jgi:hypothetical protein